MVIDIKKALLNKTILTVVCFDENLGLNIEGQCRLDIPTHCAFWRIHDGKSVIATSEDFYAKSFSPTCQFEGPDCWPMPEPEETIEDEEGDHLEQMFELFEEHREIIATKLLEILEESKIQDVKTSDLGDITLQFDNGLELEVFSYLSNEQREQMPVYKKPYRFRS